MNIHLCDIIAISTALEPISCYREVNRECRVVAVFCSSVIKWHDTLREHEYSLIFLLMILFFHPFLRFFTFFIFFKKECIKQHKAQITLHLRSYSGFFSNQLWLTTTHHDYLCMVILSQRFMIFFCSFCVCGLNICMRSITSFGG